MAGPVKCTVGGSSERRYETEREAGGQLHWHGIDSSNSRSVYSPHFRCAVKMEVEVEVTNGEALSPIRLYDVMQYAAMNGTGTYTGKVPPKLRRKRNRDITVLVRSSILG